MSNHKLLKSLSRAQKIQIRAFQTRKPYINERYIKMRLSDYDLSLPHYVMDFESVMYCPPLYAQSRAYDHTCFQFSILKGSCGVYERIEYLAEPGVDCRREFIEELIKALGNTGNIYVYNAAFEKTRMLELADLFDLHEPIELIIDRLVDAMEFFRGYHVYFPEQLGSYSLKTILPILVPELSYKNMEINNGAKAMAAYESMSSLTTEEQTKLRQDLLDYCYLDVYSLTKIIPAIKNLINH